MVDLEIRIETLPAIQVISAHGLGKEPQAMAGSKTDSFLKLIVSIILDNGCQVWACIMTMHMCARKLQQQE